MIKVKFIAVLLFILLSVSTSFGATLFEETFDDLSTFDCYGANMPPGWLMGTCSNCTAGTCGTCPDTDAHPSLMYFSASGYGGGYSMAQPRCNQTSNDYHSSMYYDIYSNHGAQTDLYFRWYAKFENGFDKDVSQAGCKIQDRIILGSSGGDENIYFHVESPNAEDVQLSEALYNLLDDGTGNRYQANWVKADWYDDHDWHCFEIRIKLNSAAGTANGIFQAWLDGVQTADEQNIIIKGSNGLYFNMFAFGMGNCSDAAWDQTTWKHLYYDEFVIGTSYIGPKEGSDATPDAFTFTDVTGASLSTVYTSNTITVAGIDATATVSITGGTYSKNGAAYTALAGTAVLGDTFSVRQTSSGSNGTTTNTVLTIGTVSDTYSVTTIGLLLTESFNDTSYVARGWYDTGGTPVIDTAIKYSGAGSLRTDFVSGLGDQVTGTLRRHLFTPSDRIYVRFYIKLPYGNSGYTNWVTMGSNSPHMVYVVTDQEPSDWESLAWTYGTFYMELDDVLNPTVKMQDGRSINLSYYPPETNLCPGQPNATQNKSICGGNGDCDGYGGSAYDAGGYYTNARVFYSSNHTLDTNWHKVEYWFQMNTISGGIAQSDGQMKVWYDGVLHTSYENIILRTGYRPNAKFEQIAIAPWGPGNITQSFWIDELVIYDGIQTDTPPSAQGCTISGASFR